MSFFIGLVLGACIGFCLRSLSRTSAYEDGWNDAASGNRGDEVRP